MTSEVSSAAAPASRMLVGFAWVLGFRVFDRIAGILSIMVLARLLVPAHFGLVALATSVAAFVELLSALSLDAVLIQKQNAVNDDYDTAWTIQVVMATLCALLLVLMAPLAAEFFRQPGLRQLIFVLAAAMFVDGFTNIRIVEFRKTMRFDKEFMFMASRRLLTTSVTITAAFMLRNEWALVLGIASGKCFGVLLSYFMRPYRPHFTLASRNALLHASSWLYLANAVQFVRLRLSDFVLGRMAGPTVVGAFNLANEISSIVSNEIVAPINRVALPEFSSIGNVVGVVQRFNQLTGQIAIFLMPMGIGLMSCSHQLVEVFFGKSWGMAAEVLGILAISGLISGLGSNIGVAFLALGKFRKNAMLQIAGAFILVPLLTVGATLYSYVGAALAMLVSNLIVVCVAVVTMRRAIGYRFRDFLGCLWRPAAAAAVMYLAVQPVVRHPEWFAGPAGVLQLATAVAVGAVVYVLTLLTIWVLRGRRDVPEQLTLRMIGMVWEKLSRKFRTP